MPATPSPTHPCDLADFPISMDGDQPPPDDPDDPDDDDQPYPDVPLEIPDTRPPEIDLPPLNHVRTG
jgi:hypothetical protein